MRGKKKIHPVQPDPVYNNATVAKFCNYIMHGGKKTVAQKVLYRSFDIVKEQSKKDPLEVFELALQNTSPMIEVRSRRVGGATYQVPTEVKGERKMMLAMRWILLAARSKKGKPMAEKLAAELMAAAKNEGEAVKKRENTHRMAEANRAFAHFAR